jgi:hypothetical protein
MLGAVYTCDFADESPYNSVYDFLPKASLNKNVINFGRNV